jgi:uncharacterized protein YkwD
MRAHVGRRGLLARAVLAIAAIAVAGPVAAAPGAPAATPTSSAGIVSVDPIADLLAQINALRRQAGLAPLRAEPALARIAAARAEAVARSGDFEGSPEIINELTRDLRVAGYPPYSWRQRLVQGPRDAASLLRQWRSSDDPGFTHVVLGDYEGFGAAVAPGTDPPLWSVFVALPRITWERRLAEPLERVEVVREQVLLRLNPERERRGLPPLVSDATLQSVADDDPGDMVARRFYDHVSPDGHDLGWRLQHAGYAFRWAAENIAKGLFTPTEVVDRWMQSSGHRHNILAPEARRVGIGVRRTEEDGHVTALWVLDFSG